MPFEVSARTILQLGRELISSDGVAFYELIKNAFDAQEMSFQEQKSTGTKPDDKNVWVRVVVRLAFDDVVSARRDLANPKANVKQLAFHLSTLVDASALGAEEYTARLAKATSKKSLLNTLDDAAVIEFHDRGEGMSIDDLKNVYLLIGTPSRRSQQDQLHDHVFLGEKGIGRLSTMRLGDKLLVKTARAKNKKWNTLEIDWRRFESDGLVEDVDVQPQFGESKSREESGTTIRITALRDHWTEEKLRDIATKELSRFVDPFAKKNVNEIFLSFNGSAVGILPLNKLLFDQAHAKVTGGLKIRKRGGPLFWADIDFRQYDRFQEVRIEKSDLASITGALPEEIESIGPFDFTFYWFNRQALTAVEAIGKKRDVQKLVNQWSGGLMLYRDGFRVPPYGGSDDDWLGIDKVALGSQGYKVNRAQLVGKIDIGKLTNPRLVDQTNREGLQDTSEKKQIESLMFYFLTSNFRSYIDQVAEEHALQNLPEISEIQTRFKTQQKRLKGGVQALKKIARDNPELDLGSLTKEFSEIALSVSQTISLVTTKQKDVEARSKRLIDLAGLGLLIDMIAHDLNHSLIQSVAQIRKAAKSSADRSLLATLKSAEAQLKTLQKRVSRIDKAAISGRQRKSSLKVYDVLKNVFEGREAQLKEYGIRYSISETRAAKSFQVKFVEGMLYQIFENLVENSVYWLRQDSLVSKSKNLVIDVRIDAANRIVYFSDNGPGIAPANIERVFGHAFTLKGRSTGKGLGLYISRVLAKDQGASLDLSSESTREDGYLNTFALELPST